MQITKSIPEDDLSKQFFRKTESDITMQMFPSALLLFARRTSIKHRNVAFVFFLKTALSQHEGMLFEVCVSLSEKAVHLFLTCK